MSFPRKPLTQPIQRRRFLGGAALAGVAGLTPIAGKAGALPEAAGQAFGEMPDYGVAVRETARWIRAAESDRPGGVWLPEPDHPEIKSTVSLPNGFYTGSAGLVLFFIELAQATGDKSYWDDARRGGDYLA